MGKYMVCRHSSEGKIEEFYYNSFYAAFSAKLKWEEDYYYCEIYVRLDLV